MCVLNRLGCDLLSADPRRRDHQAVAVWRIRTGKRVAEIGDGLGLNLNRRSCRGVEDGTVTGVGDLEGSASSEVGRTLSHQRGEAVDSVELGEGRVGNSVAKLPC